MAWLPDVSKAPFKDAPVATFVAAPADGVLPTGFFSTSNLPTYVRTADGWQAPVRPRMDCVVVRRGPVLETLEPRKVRRGEPVLTALDEQGKEGVVVSVDGFLGPTWGANEFQFMGTEVSRERPVNYDDLASHLRTEKVRGGFIIWITGPALVHARARGDFEWLIRNGYVQAVLAGNAVAVHDIEAALFGTTLGMDNSGRPTQGGHGLHMRAINAIRAVGSIERAVESGLIRTGIMHALVTGGIPYVLAGSIRDDGPLPGVITDNLAAQDAMREFTVRATAAVFVATALHAIAVGNMLPAFHTHTGDGHPEPLTTICVDQTEFVVNKLRDRGTHQAFGVVTNAQDFMHIIRLSLE